MLKIQYGVGEGIHKLGNLCMTIGEGESQGAKEGLKGWPCYGSSKKGEVSSPMGL